MLNTKNITKIARLNIAAKAKSIKTLIEADLKALGIADDQLNKQTKKYFNAIQEIIQSYLKKGIIQNAWFYQRYTSQNKHIQDIINLTTLQPLTDKLVIDLQLLKKYSNLDKNIKNNLKKSFQPTENFTLNDLEIALNKQDKKQISKERALDKPDDSMLVSLKEISNTYKVYQFDDTKEHAQMLQDIVGIGEKNLNAENNYDKYQKYATAWCVANGQYKYNKYLDSDPKKHHYYYVSKNDQPYILMNFTKKSNIKNIHDNNFTNYDKDTIKIVQQLMERDGIKTIQNKNKIFKLFGFIKNVLNGNQSVKNIKDIFKENKDFKLFGFIKNVLNGNLNVKNIKDNNKKIYEQNSYQFYEYNNNYCVIKDDEIKYLITDNIVKIDKKEKYDNPVLFDFCKGFEIKTPILNLIDNGYITIQNKNYYEKIMVYLIDENMIINLSKSNYLILTQNIFNKFIEIKDVETLTMLLLNNKIKNKNEKEEAISVIFNNYVTNNNKPMKKSIVIPDDLIKKIIDDKTIQFSDKLVEELIENRKYNILKQLLLKNKIKSNNLKYEIIDNILKETSNGGLQLIKHKIVELDYIVGKLMEYGRIQHIFILFNNDLINKKDLKNDELYQYLLQFCFEHGRLGQIQPLIKKDKIEITPEIIQYLEKQTDNDAKDILKYIKDNNIKIAKKILKLAKLIYKR